jgi:uncharacterized protein
MNVSQQTGYILFRLIVPTILLAFQALVYLRTVSWVRTSFPGSRRAVLIHALPFVVFNAAMLVVAIARPILTDMSILFRYVALYPFYLWFGSTAFLGLFFTIGSLVGYIFRAGTWAMLRIPLIGLRVRRRTETPAYRRFDQSRRLFLRRGAMGLAGVTVASTGYGIAFGRSNCEVNHREIPIHGLSPCLSGLSIGLVTDVHSSPFMSREDMDEYVARLNDLGADLIIVGGDFVNSQTEEVYPFAESFSKLKAPLGVFGVMGNHDFYAPDPRTVASEVNACGIRLLRNEGVVIRSKGAELALLGIDDTGSKVAAGARMRDAMADTPPSIPRILVSHRPYFLPEAATHDIDLVLSGHTHGGQVVLGTFAGVALTPAAIASKYVWGLYMSDMTQMYVSRGIGTVGVPMRINCPPELTRLTIVPA